jgi:recombinational DNA repair protein (RecF pathway)
LNECVNALPTFNEAAYTFYVSSREMITSKQFDDKKNILIVLTQYCKILGLHLEVNHCVACGSNKIKTICLPQYGMLCNECFDDNHHQLFDLSTSKLFHFLFNSAYEKIDQFNDQYDLVIKLLSIFVKDNAGIYLETLKNY